MRGIIIASMAVLLTACGSPSIEEKSELSARTEREAESYIKQKGAAIAFRATAAKNFWTNKPRECGNVSLTRVEGDRQLETVEVRTVNEGFRLEGMSDGREEGYRIRFTPVQPGKYIVTGLNCNAGEVGRGNGYGIFFGKTDKRPVAGANTIIIGPGEIVDAGALDFMLLRMNYGILVSHPAASGYRAMIQKNMPNLYHRITFKTFTFGGV
ncbi:hypothetical protein [Phyllobacterium leguminum]|uniref:Lipoprotein n=1 Tax=Phyllobacterium leguminum TaxID=314237 RepID=A0A318T715_9HYPH|nr:hypothetical protein [Phyllobacterium leguminum]PYE88193.1 hypothetical protein C7477_10864 [Phyllobacterium leguminum]